MFSFCSLQHVNARRPPRNEGFRSLCPVYSGWRHYTSRQQLELQNIHLLWTLGVFELQVQRRRTNSSWFTFDWCLADGVTIQSCPQNILPFLILNGKTAIQSHTQQSLVRQDLRGRNIPGESRILGSVEAEVAGNNLRGPNGKSPNFYAIPRLLYEIYSLIWRRIK